MVKRILITGGGKRIGQQIARSLHTLGHALIVHYRSSGGAAQSLIDELNAERPNSAVALQADLLDTDIIPALVHQAVEAFDGLDVLINNASTFYPTPIELLDDEFWNDLMGSNLKAPAFLAKSCTPHLRKSQGCIVNILDIHARRPMAQHPVYCAAKAGLEMLTLSLARDLAPDIRVNGVSPGAILWPENDQGMDDMAEILEKIPMQRMGSPEDVAKLVGFLIDQAPYITGQVIAVDGGRSVMI